MTEYEDVEPTEVETIEESNEDNSVELKLEALERKLEALEKVVSTLVEKKEEESKCEEPGEEEEEEEEEKKSEEEEKANGGLIGAITNAVEKIKKKVKDEKIKGELDAVLEMLANVRRAGYPYPYPMPTSYPYPTKYPYPAKAEWPEMVVNAIDALWEKISELSNASKTIEELSVATKAKDDVLKALDERLKALETASGEEKTIIEKSDETPEDDSDDSPTVIISRGEVKLIE